MCHMLADSLEELHEMADRIGMRRAWFQDKPGGIPHYDLMTVKRAMAVECGAIEVDRRRTAEIIRMWRKKGEPRVVDKFFGISLPGMELGPQL